MRTHAAPPAERLDLSQPKAARERKKGAAMLYKLLLITWGITFFFQMNYVLISLMRGETFFREDG